MAEYIANQIILGQVNYTTATAKRPELKDGINAFLTKKGKEDLTK